MHLGYIWRRLSWNNIRILTTILTITGLFLGLFVWRLDSLTPGISQPEALSRISSSNFHIIINYPIDAPQRLVQLLFHYLSPGSIFLLRLASVIWAGIFIACFYYLASRWFGKVIGLLGTILFTSTPWFILSARSASPVIMLLMPLAIASCYVWALKRKNHPDLAAIVLVAVTSISLYVFGMMWFIIVAGYFARKQLKVFISRTSVPTRIICFVISLVILAPLIRAAILEPGIIIKPLLLIPATFVGLYGFIKAFAWSSLAIVWRTQSHLDISIGSWPMLSAVQSVLLIFGVFAIFTQAISVGFMLAIFAGICILIAAINNNSILLLAALPIICMFITAGLRYLYIEWKAIFPRNPLPRALAVSLMVILVAMQLFFGIRYALVAWPHTTDTLRLYMLK